MQSSSAIVLRGNLSTISLCLINQKGGCGKSSTCFHLAGAFAAMGRSVLLIDADPQGSLSQAFLGPTVIENLPANQTLAAFFDQSCFNLNHHSLVHKTQINKISIIPANQHLAEFNVPRPELTGMMQFVLRDLVEQYNDFNVILFDCPPNLYQCSWNAMLAAEHVLIPVPPEDFGTQGLRAVHQAVDHARQLNPTLRRFGHLVSRYDRRLLIHRSYESRLRSLYGHMVLDTTIPELSAFKVALACRKPVQYYSSKSTAAATMRNLVDEIHARIAAKAKRAIVG